jgi:hypothetical protein
MLFSHPYPLYGLKRKKDAGKLKVFKRWTMGIQIDILKCLFVI